MIELYSENNTNYTKNGNVVLMPTECIAKAEIGGQWSLKLIHPIDEGGRWTFLSEEAVIKAPAYNGAQLWRIRHREKDDFEVAVECEPIFFDSMQDCFLVDVRPTNKTGTQALALMLTNNKYSAVSDITATSTAYYEYKNLMEALQGNDDNAFVKRWGGELAFDNFTVWAMTALGSDNGVRIFYGKNVEAIKETVDMTEVVTRVYPVGYNGRRYTGGSGYVDSPLLSNYPTVKTASREYRNIMLASDAPESASDDPANVICNDQAALNTALAAAVNAEYSAGLDKPAVTLVVDMVDLRNAQEYQEYSDLEAVSLGDTVHLYHSRLGITSEERVIAIEYDSITQSTKKITLGVKEYNYFNQVTGSLTQLTKTVDASQGIPAEVAQAASKADAASQAVAGLGSMATEDAQLYPTQHKEQIYNAALNEAKNHIYKHDYAHLNAQQAGGSWIAATTDTPIWSGVSGGKYLVLASVRFASGGAGACEFRVTDGTDPIGGDMGRGGVGIASGNSIETTATAAFVWDYTDVTKRPHIETYGSRSYNIKAASIAMIMIGGS